MKTLVQLTIALVALAVGAGCATTQSQNTTGSEAARASAAIAFSPQDETAVRAKLAELANTWNSHDLKGLRELFTEDAIWIRHSGNTWRGKDRMYINLVFDATTPTLGLENIEVRAVDPQVAVAMATMKYSTVVLPSGETNPEWKNRATFVLVKRGDAWKIAHVHKSNLTAGIEQVEAGLRP